MKRLWILSTLCWLFPTVILASETDDYLQWRQPAPLKDSREIFNTYLNQEIQQVVDKYNKKLIKLNTCEALTHKIGQHFALSHERRTSGWVEANPSIDVLPSREHSDQAQFDMSIYAGTKYMKLARTLNINGIHFGSDKISHSISMGYMYFIAYRADLNLNAIRHLPSQARERARKKAIEVGVHSEKGILGIASTGVFSNADLEANYQGLEMYISMCEGDNPRLIQVGKKWEFVRKIDFAEYVNPNWNETFNPSFVEPKLWLKIKPHVQTYCKHWKSENVQSSLDNFRKTTTPSFSREYISKLRDDGKAPNHDSQLLETICN